MVRGNVGVLVNAILKVTGAARIFTQDVEDLKKTLAGTESPKTEPHPIPVATRIDDYGGPNEL